MCSYIALHEMGRMDILVSFLILKKNSQIFTFEYDVICGLVMYDFYYVELVV